MLKILLIHNYYQTHHVGGEDKVFDNEFKLLSTVLGKSNVFKYVVNNDQINKKKILFTIWGNYFHAKAVYKLILKNKINIVHVHNYFPLMTPLVFKAAKKAGARVILTLHNYRPHCLSGLLYRESQPWCTLCVNKNFKWYGVKYGCYRQSKLQSLIAACAFAWYGLRKYFDYIDYYFSLTHFQTRLLEQFKVPRDKIHLKPNGICVPLIRPNSKRNGFIYIGRLENAKGFHHLLKAWQNLELPLYIVGAVNQSLISYHPNINFVGKVEHDKVLEYIKCSKYLIHPGEAVETFGLTILEALAHGTPVIALNRGTRKELIKDNYNGFLCEPDELMKTIQKAEEIPDYERLSQNAHLSAKQFNYDLIINRQIECYQTLL